MAESAAMRLIIVGAGGIGRELLRRLGSTWDVVVVDEDQERLDRAASIRSFESHVGDGSSAVVLKRAGLEHAAALVAATEDDDTNLEAVRLAKEAGLLRIAGVAAVPERSGDYEALGIPGFSPSEMAARNIELALEPRKVASSAFAGGKAEAIEVHIAPDASVAGKRLRDLYSESWIIAAVLRDDRLIVPHGDTRLEVGDRVTVVGAASDYSAIVADFTSGVSTFPLGFGRGVAVALETDADDTLVLSEAVRLVRHSRADSLVVVLPEPSDGGGDGAGIERAKELMSGLADGIDVHYRQVGETAADGLAAVASEENIGVVVVRGTSPDARFRRFKISRLLGRYLETGVPLLLARAGGPYDEVLVPARRTRSGEAAARAAIDLATSSGIQLSGVAAVAPAFVATRTDTVEEARLAMARLREEAAVHGTTVRRKVRQGNPVRVIAGLVTARSLLVMAAPEPPISAIDPGISGLVAARVPCSVLLVPKLRRG